jgi:hypothetical protein
MLLLWFVTPTVTFAEGMKHIPPWTMINGKACYEFADAKKLLLIDAGLESLIQTEQQWAALAASLKDGATQLSLALEAEKSLSATLLANNEVLNKHLLTETQRANTAEARPGAFPAWAIAGGAGLAVGIVAGVVLGVYIAKK